MSDQVWFYEKDRNPSGPVSEAELWELLKSGEITKDSLVWRQPMEKWLPFSDVEQLRIPPKPKPPPMPEPEFTPDVDDSAFKPPEQPEEPPEEHVEKVVFDKPDYKGGETTTMDAEFEEVTQVRPWVRFFARITDYYVFSMLFTLLISFMFPDFMEQMSQGLTEQTTLENSDEVNYQSILFVIIMRIVVTFVWVFLEAYTISKYGTTFGKNLLGTRVLDTDGELLPYDRALKRSYSVWLKGMGAGFVLISWITMLFGYQSLRKDGVTSWDEESGSKVVHTNFSSTRLIIILGFFFLIEFVALRSVL
ncbi:MAG: RDD family protein [Thermodesulfobacteriota bacterium]